MFMLRLKLEALLCISFEHIIHFGWLEPSCEYLLFIFHISRTIQLTTTLLNSKQPKYGRSKLNEGAHRAAIKSMRLGSLPCKMYGSFFTDATLQTLFTNTAAKNENCSKQWGREKKAGSLLLMYVYTCSKMKPLCVSRQIFGWG